MERHSSILYIMVTLLLVFQLISFIFMTIQVSKLSAKIDSEIFEVRSNLTGTFTSLLNEYDSINQRNFNELSLAITQQAAQQENFKQQINLVKTGHDDFSGVIENAVKSVVAVMTDDSMGSGFIVNPEGYIVTNYHVIERTSRVNVLLYDKRVLQAQIMGVDKLRDLALLKIEGSYSYLHLADSDQLQLGRKVIAIGNPLGLSFTVTEGIISGLDREGPNGIEEYVQTDVSLNPGNSGGPLIDMNGEVIGINNFKIGGAESLGFALESNSIKQSINAILNEEIII